MATLSVRTKRILVISLVALATVASGVTSYVVGHHFDSRRAAGAGAPVLRPADLGIRPRLQWILDTERIAGDVVARPLFFPGRMNGSGIGPGSVGDSPSVLIAAVGHPLYGRFDSEDGRGIVVDSATLIGVDRATGNPTWRRNVGYVTQCSDTTSSVTIACWSTNRVVFVDTGTGALRSEMKTDFEMIFASVVDGRAYVSGRRSTLKGRVVVLTAGTVDDPTSTFRRTFDVRGPGASVAEVLPSRNTVTVSEMVPGVVQYRTTAYDLDTGRQRFSFDGDLRSVGTGLFRAYRFTDATVQLLDERGAVQVARVGPAWVASPVPASAPFIPVIAGSEAFDPARGTRLWGDQILDAGTDTQSAVRAFVGSLVIVASPSDRAIVGLDARTGRRVWQTPWRDAYWIRDGFTDGRYFVFADFTGMHSLDTTTGTIVWTVRLPRGVDPRGVTVTGAGGTALRTTERAISLWR